MASCYFLFSSIAILTFINITTSGGQTNQQQTEPCNCPPHQPLYVPPGPQGVQGPPGVQGPQGRFTQNTNQCVQ